MTEVSAEQLVFASPHDLQEYCPGQARYIPDDTVHVWAFELACSDRMINTFLQTLSCDEILRSRRFMRAQHCTEFVVAHGILRAVLSQYCGILASELRFMRGVAGKPSIIPVEGLALLPYFNLAHCGSRMILAITSGSELGVDLECERNEILTLEIAERFFCAAEFNAIMARPDEKRAAAFFRYWVAKEAVLKANGVGLGFPLNQFMILWGSQQVEARAVSFDRQRLENDFSVRMLNCEPAWHAAVSTRSASLTVSVQAMAPLSRQREPCARDGVKSAGWKSVSEGATTP